MSKKKKPEEQQYPFVHAGFSRGHPNSRRRVCWPVQLHLNTQGKETRQLMPRSSFKLTMSKQACTPDKNTGHHALSADDHGDGNIRDETQVLTCSFSHQVALMWTGKKKLVFYQVAAELKRNTFFLLLTLRIGAFSSHMSMRMSGLRRSVQ